MMRSKRHQPVRSTGDAAAIGDVARQTARRAAAAACRPASPMQAAGAAPFWRAMSDESMIWGVHFPASRS
jgi:hypothetical protein